MGKKLNLTINYMNGYLIDQGVRLTKKPGIIL